MNMTILKDYEMEAENRDDAESIALTNIKNNLQSIEPDFVDGFAVFKSEE